MRKTYLLKVLFLFLLIITLTHNQELANENDHNYYDSNQNEDQQFDPLDFAQFMNFYPSQSIIIELQPNRQQSIFFQPPPQMTIMRGQYHLHFDFMSDPSDVNDWESENVDVVTIMQVNGQIQKKFTHHRYGYFLLKKPQSQKGPMKVKITFKSIMKRSISLTNDFSKKLIQQNKYDEKQKENGNDTLESSEQNDEFKKQQQKLIQIQSIYLKVLNKVKNQQSLSSQLRIYSTKITRELESHLISNKYRIVLQTLIVMIVGLVCLYFLRKKLLTSYHLLV